VLLGGHAKSFDTGVYVGQKVFHCLVELVVDLEGSLLRNDTVHSVVAQVVFDSKDTEQANSSLDNFLRLLVITHCVHCSNALLQHESVTECRGQSLDLVGDLVHPNIEESLSILHDTFLKVFAECFNIFLLSKVDEVGHGFDIVDRLHLGDLINGVLSKLGHVVLFLLQIREDVLHHLLHEHAVITLGSHC